MRNNNRKKLPIIILMVLIIVIVALIGCKKNETGRENEESNLEQTETVNSQENNKLLIVTGEYVPYTTQMEPGYGFFTQIVEAVLKESSVDYEIEFYPWARCSEMVKNGEAWATFPYGYTAEMAESFYFSDAVMKGRYKFYYLKSNEKFAQETMNFSEISDFTNFTFGGAVDYWYGDQSIIESYGVKTEWAKDTDALIKMLHAGRIDFLVEDELVGDAAITRLFPEEIDEFAKLPNTARLQDYYLIISKGYPNSEANRIKFNEALKKLLENGEIERILAENGIQPVN